MLDNIYIAIPIALLVLRIIWKFIRPAKGDNGERRVASILKKLPTKEYKVINDLILRTENVVTSQLDHVVVSEYGIFVIETKFYQGDIIGSDKSEYWTQNIYGNKYKLRNPVHQNYGHICTLRYKLRDSGDLPIISIVAFSRQAKLHVNSRSYVLYWDQILSIIRQYKEPTISKERVIAVHDRLLDCNLVSKETRKQHIKDVKQIVEKRRESISSGVCPKCGGKLVSRSGSYGPFLGCSNYPKCKYIHK